MFRNYTQHYRFVFQKMLIILSCIFIEEYILFEILLYPLLNKVRNICYILYSYLQIYNNFLEFFIEQDSIFIKIQIVFIYMVIKIIVQCHKELTSYIHKNFKITFT